MINNVSIFYLLIDITKKKGSLFDILGMNSLFYRLFVYEILTLFPRETKCRMIMS